MDLSALQALLDRVSAVRVACVGDVMLDRYVYGEAARISPEAPVPVLRETHRASMLGGAGNVARNVTALGARVDLVGVLGDDAAGEEVARLVEAEPRMAAALVREPGGRTTEKVRYVAAGQQLLRVDVDRAAGAHALAPERLAADVVCVSDYAKGVVTPQLMDAVRAARGGAPLIVDPKRRDLAAYGPVDLLKPNAAELAAATGLPTGSDIEVEAALVAALAGSQAQAVLVTRAAAGMSWLERGGQPRHLHGRAREVFDVSGAGDTSLAALAVALGAGAPLEQAVELALLASGVVVGKAGTAVATPADLVGAEIAGRAETADGKIVGAERAAACAARWRDEGLRVGFTNGCFDVLHRGHVSYLAQARGWCDRLIVGLNSDRSVRALKGEGRPVNDLEGRALVLAGLSSVDLVAPFDADTPLALIEAVRPDVLVKGADYTEAQVVGASFVRGYGGEVRLAPLVEGQSTTAVIARMRA